MSDASLRRTKKGPPVVADSASQIPNVGDEPPSGRVPSLKMMRAGLRAIEERLEQLEALLRERDQRIAELQRGSAKQPGLLDQLLEHDTVETSVNHHDTVVTPALGNGRQARVSIDRAIASPAFRAALLQNLRYFVTTPVVGRLQALLDTKADIPVDLGSEKPKLALSGSKVQANGALKMLVVGSTRQFVEAILQESLQDLALALGRALETEVAGGKR